MNLINSLVSFFRFNNRNWKAVMLCILTATVFWFFNALNENYSANINFPVAFEFDEENYVPVKPLPEHVRLNVSGLGWDLFRKSVGLKVPPLTIPLELPSEVKKIVGASLPPLFSPQLEGLQINFVLTDTMHLQIDPKTTRKVFVAVNSVEQNLKDDFGLSSSVLIQPNVVLLEGPQSLLQGLPDTVLIQLPSRNIDKPYKDDIEVELASDLINRNPPVVNVTFSVGRVMEITDTVTLQLINLPREVRSTIQVKEIHYTYSLPITLAHTISPDSVHAVLDFSGLSKDNNKLIPKITGLPAFSKLIRIDTVFVNF